MKLTRPASFTFAVALFTLVYGHISGQSDTALATAPAFEVFLSNTAALSFTACTKQARVRRR